MARKATLEDVAALAGVSIATVDRVVNRRGGVEPEREGRVLAAARRLDLDRRLGRAYAHRLRVAVLIQPPANPFHAALARAFASANRAFLDLDIQFLVHHLDPNRPERILGLIARPDRRAVAAAGPQGQPAEKAARDTVNTRQPCWQNSFTIAGLMPRLDPVSSIVLRAPCGPSRSRMALP